VTTSSLHEFEENIQYARDLIAGGIDLQARSLRDFPAHPEDLFRAAWSQAVSAMDHWLHDELIERAVVLASDLGNVRTSKMNDLKVPFADVERMRDVSFPVVFRDFLAKEFERRSFHGTTDISDGMKLVCQLTPDQLWTTVGRTLSLTRDQVKQRHNDVIRRRNDISHRADRDASGHRQPMTDGEVTAAVNWIDTLVHELHGLFG
jgi:hypothetical protein